MGEFDERLLARGRDLAALDPGQIGWGDATSGSDLPEGVSRILLGALLAEFANMVAKGCAETGRGIISLHVAYIDNMALMSTARNETKHLPGGRVADHDDGDNASYAGPGRFRRGLGGVRAGQADFRALNGYPSVSFFGELRMFGARIAARGSDTTGCCGGSLPRLTPDRGCPRCFRAPSFHGEGTGY